MKLENMDVDDLKMLKSCLYKLIDHELEFYNFMAGIPKALKDEECKIWTTIPSTDTNNVSQIVNQYNLRCKYLDEQISKI